MQEELDGTGDLDTAYESKAILTASSSSLSSERRIYLEYLQSQIWVVPLQCCKASRAGLMDRRQATDVRRWSIKCRTLPFLRIFYSSWSLALTLSLSPSRHEFDMSNCSQENTSRRMEVESAWISSPKYCSHRTLPRSYIVLQDDYFVKSERECTTALMIFENCNFVLT